MNQRTISSIILIATCALFIGGTALAAPTSTPVQNLIITGVKNAPCLSTDGNGLVGSTPCGTGGGGGSSSIINGVTTQIVNFSLASSSNAFSITTSSQSVVIHLPNNVGAFSNDKSYTTTTIQAVLNALSAAGLATYNSSTGVFTVSSSSLALGTASQYNKSDVLTSSTVVNTPSTTIPTVYVSTFNGSSGAITYAPSTTIPTVYVTSFNTRTGVVTLSSGDVTTALGFTPYNSTNPNGYISSLTGALLAASNLSDLTNTSTARTNLGLGSIATHPTTDYVPSSTVITNTVNGQSGTVVIPNVSSSTAGIVSTSTYAQIADKAIPFTIDNPLATENDILYAWFPTTSTILEIANVNGTTGDTITANIGWASSRATATSSWNHIFASNTTFTATTTPSCYAAVTTTLCATGTFGANASTTISAGSVLMFYTTAASSSESNFTIWYREGN